MSTFPSHAPVPGFPRLTYKGTLTHQTELELENLVSLIQGYLGVNHNQDGTHSDVMANSVSSTLGFQELDRTQILGVPEVIQYDPANFNGDAGMTWQVADANQVITAALFGTLMYLSGKITASNVTAPVSPRLLLLIPFNLVSANDAVGTLIYRDAGGAEAMGMSISTANGSRYISFEQVGRPNWTATAANNTDIQFTIVFNIQPLIE